MQTQLNERNTMFVNLFVIIKLRQSLFCKMYHFDVIYLQTQLYVCWNSLYIRISHKCHKYSSPCWQGRIEIILNKCWFIDFAINYYNRNILLYSYSISKFKQRLHILKLSNFNEFLRILSFFWFCIWIRNHER